MSPRTPDSAPLNYESARRRLPYPIASAWQRVTLAKSDSDRIPLLTASAEILLRTLVALLLPDYLRGPKSEEIDATLATLNKVADGTWNRLVRELVGHISQRTDPPPFFPEIGSWYQSDPAQRFNEIVERRNNEAHGAERAVYSEDWTRDR
ncbi:MAG TPA: hypothetical protein VFN10_15480, partial [Thermoanaerobaculia bacterium]|nr:hypothetical protein [Thermoanaerobaculia bacterium]